MTDDLRDGLDREFARYTPDIRISTEEMIHKGRRRVRRRRFGIAGAATGGVAAIAAVALLAPSLFAGATTPTEGPAADEKDGQSLFQEAEEFPVALEPDTEYWWVSTEIWAANESDVYSVPGGAAEVVAELWNQLDAVGYPYDPYVREDGLELTRHPEALIVDPDQSPSIGQDGFTSVKPEDALLERAVYGLEVGSPIDGDAAGSETLSLHYYPAGSYLKGAATAEKHPHRADPRYLVAGCDPVTHHDVTWDADVTASFECSESTGPNGEQILTVVESLDYGVATLQDRTTVVVYREDGSATVLEEFTWGPGEPSTSADVFDGWELKLTPKQLEDIVLSLPPIEVR